MIEGHGDDSFRYGTMVCHNFSSNICSDVDHSGLMAYLASVGEGIKSYPEPEPLSLGRMLAAEAGIDEGCVAVTNGATEAIYLIAQMSSGSEKSVIVGPTFREYQDACRIHGHRVTHIGALSDIPEDSVTVWLCNPNNPTGKVYDKEELLGLIDSMLQTVFIIDQAYSDYTALPLLTAPEVARRDNVITLHSLTKRFAIPGLRIGYAIGSHRLIGRMRELRMPWSVNQLAIEAAKYLLDNKSNYHIDADGLHREALRIAESLRALGIAVSDTDCNFILCKLPAGNAAELKEYLVNSHGILIRDASNFEGLGKGHFRVAAQKPVENDMLINAIRQWMESL